MPGPRNSRRSGWKVPLGEPLHARLAYNDNLTARVFAPIAGRITRLSLQVGDRVRAGQVLLALDAPELAAAVADLRKARAEDERRRLALERAQRLFDAGVMPRRELEGAQAEADVARAEAQRAERRLRNLSATDADSAAYTLRSPLDGVVAERRVNPGMEVRPDLPDPLFVITETSRLWVLIDLPERELALVRPGQRALVRADAWPTERFIATIERIGERVDPATRRVEVRAVVDNLERRLKPEMYVQVTQLPDQGPAGGAAAQCGAGHPGALQLCLRRRSPGFLPAPQGDARRPGPHPRLRHRRGRGWRVRGHHRRAAAELRAGHAGQMTRGLPCSIA